MLIVSIIFIAIGFLLLIKGADYLVEGAIGIAKKFHIPEVIIGLTIISIGTSLPELFVSITSAMSGHADMSIGNVIGSNISNLLLILGLSTAIQPIFFKKDVKFLDIPICLFVTLIFAILCNVEKTITFNNGILLIIIFISFIIYTIVLALKERKETQNIDEQNYKNEEKQTSTLSNLIFVILGIIGLKFGGDLTVENAVIIAEKLALSEKIISVTIVSIGTSLPELVTTVSAALKKKSDIAIGNIIGSNIFNMLLIIGASAIISPIKYSTSYNKDILILIVATTVLGLFSIIPPKDKMTRTNGIIYLCFYILYMISLFAW